MAITHTLEVILASLVLESSSYTSIWLSSLKASSFLDEMILLIGIT
jgi:hypothetical protein